MLAFVLKIKKARHALSCTCRVRPDLVVAGPCLSHHRGGEAAHIGDAGAGRGGWITNFPPPHFPRLYLECVICPKKARFTGDTRFSPRQKESKKRGRAGRRGLQQFGSQNESQNSAANSLKGTASYLSGGYRATNANNHGWHPVGKSTKAGLSEG